MTAVPVERFAEEMVARWAAGDRPLTEEFLDRAPRLWDDPDAALELIAEELALRDEHALLTTADELAARFPMWGPQVRALFDCHEVLTPRLAPPAFPKPGDRLGEFELRVELGRGAHGRVYLATQPSLAGRPVVLKIGPDTGEEHLSLARLQHTHIVPLYSVHDYPDRRLRALCMPDFGGATLADVGAHLSLIRRPCTGSDVLAAVRRPGPALPTGAAWGFLERAALTDAACWIGAALADALQFAHERGLLHLDVKPSNVLLAGDGTPMLLDFHLARPPLTAGDADPGWVGGTPGYMAPEHAAALDAAKTGRPVPAAVDGRADVFALGMSLRELLRAGGATVGTGLGDVLARCTATAAADRYPTAGDLAADLRRHLSDLPLKGVANRSLAERWRKWRRRRPAALPLGVAAAALAAVAGGIGAHAARLGERGWHALDDGRAAAAAGQYDRAADLFRSGESLIDGVPLLAGLRSELRAARTDAERAAAADDLHDFAEKIRPLAVAEGLAPAQLATAARRCREVWERREVLSATLAGQPSKARDARWRADLLDVGILAADLTVRDAPEAGQGAAVREALETLAEAERRFGPAAALDLERARYARALGSQSVASAADRRAAEHPPRGAWEHLLVARSHLAAGDAGAAAASADAAVSLDPRSAWGHYLRGVCLLRAKQPTEAAAAFSACAALAPDVAWCVYNRGVAFAAAGRPEAARADFDRAVALDPRLSAAYAARASLNATAGRFAEALADAERAASAGGSSAEANYLAGTVHASAGNPTAAVASLRAALAADPKHRAAARLLEQLSAK